MAYSLMLAAALRTVSLRRLLVVILSEAKNPIERSGDPSVARLPQDDSSVVGIQRIGRNWYKGEWNHVTRCNHE